MFKILVGALLVLVSQSSMAHMMVAQHGTLNVHENGVYMVLSLPVSGFGNADVNGDGQFSAEEFNASHQHIVQTIQSNVALQDENQRFPLEGLMFSLADSHHNQTALAKQLIVMGRFALSDNYQTLRFTMGIFGEQDPERGMEIRATDKTLALNNTFTLSYQQDTQPLFH